MKVLSNAGAGVVVGYGTYNSHVENFSQLTHVEDVDALDRECFPHIFYVIQRNPLSKTHLGIMRK